MQKWHEKVLHIASNAGDEVQTPLPEFLVWKRCLEI